MTLRNADRIVSGAYYEREDGAIVGPAMTCHLGPTRDSIVWQVGDSHYYATGSSVDGSRGPRLVYRVTIVRGDISTVLSETIELANRAAANCGRLLGRLL